MTSQNKILITVGGLIVVGVAYWLISPLFIDKEVNEDIPFVTENSNIAEQIPDMEIRSDYGSKMLEMQGEGNEMSETMPVENQDPEITATGSFVEVAHAGGGDAKIINLGGEKGNILRLENLDVLNGPDLHVLLSRSTYVKTSGDLGEYVELGELKGNKGNQNYEISANVDLSKYNTVIIYCKSFGVVFNVARLDKSM